MSEEKRYPWQSLVPRAPAPTEVELWHAGTVLRSTSGRVTGIIVTTPEDTRNKIRRMNHRLQELLHIGWGPQELRQVRRMLVDQNELLAEIAGIQPEPQQLHDLAQI